jgi:hypothetical protein
MREWTMNVTTEKVANIAVTTMCLAVIYAVTDRVVLPKFSAPSSTVSVFKTGDSFAAGSEWNTSRAKLTVVLVVSNKCSFCSDSVPFYRRLIALRQQTQVGALQITFIGARTAADATGFLAQHGFGNEDARAMPAELSNRIHGTPTLILVTSDNLVAGNWEGKLSESQETVVYTKVLNAIDTATTEGEGGR